MKQEIANGGRMFGDDFRSFSGLNKAVIEFANLNSLSIDVVDGNFWDSKINYIDENCFDWSK